MYLMFEPSPATKFLLPHGPINISTRLKTSIMSTYLKEVGNTFNLKI